MKCGCCGKEAGDFTFDKTYQMPDVIWNLDEAVRAERAAIHGDFCRLNDDYVLRGMVYLPLIGADRCFGWGLWAEVGKEEFFNYFENYENDNSSSSPFVGRMANSIPFYSETNGIALNIKLGDETLRPIFYGTEQGHLLFKEQNSDVNLERVHDFNGR